MNDTCVIIGASHAGVQLAFQLRGKGWQGGITLISEEPHQPYHRPPLSKSFLAGEQSFQELWLRPPQIFEDQGIELMLSTSVDSIDRHKKQLSLRGGRQLEYHKLALTTGSKVRKINIPGSDSAGIHYLRNRDDVDLIRPLCSEGKRALIIGGGYIGLEVAAIFRKLNLQVRLLEAMPRLLQRVATEAISDFFHREHQRQGVDIVTAAAVASITETDGVYRVQCTDGSHYDTDFIIVAIGIIPAIELAKDAGLDVENGILVDEFAQTSDADIVAAGDVTYHYNPIYDRYMRLESVQNANNQAVIAANTLCGQRQPYRAVPWFWSDQYDIRLQIAGLAEGYDQSFIRGAIDSGSGFAIFYLKSGKLISVVAVNEPQAFMFARRVIGTEAQLDWDKLKDTSIKCNEALISTAE